LTDDHAEQRRFADAVAADYADDAATRQVEVQVVGQQLVAERLGETRGLEHVVAQTRTGRDDDLVAVDLGRGGLIGELVVRAQARFALGLTGARRGAHPLELLLEFARARVLLFLFVGEARRLLLQPSRVV